MKTRVRKSSHSGAHVLVKSLSIGSSLNAADSSHSNSGILDVYGIKTKPVDLLPYISEISLKDLLREELKRPQLIHEIVRAPNKESKDSLYPEIIRILQCCCKWPDKAALSQEIHVGATLNTIDRGQWSMNPGHASKYTSQPEAHDILSMETASCSKVSRNIGFFEAGALVSENPNVQSGLEDKNAFSVDSLPLKPFGDCVRSLKLSDFESLDNLIAQVAGYGTGDWSVVAACSNQSNKESMPPLPFSHPPVWTLKADVVHEHCIMKGKPAQIKLFKRINDTKEPLQGDSSEYYCKKLKGGKGVSSGSVKYQAEQVFHAGTTFANVEQCCHKYLSHVSNSMPVEAFPSEVFTAACILFHMASELPFSLLESAEKKTGQRSLQRYHDVPCQKPAKSLNVASSAAVPHSNINGQGDDIRKTSRSLIPSKVPLEEMKKCPSQVGNAPAVVPVRTLPRWTGGIPLAPLSTTGVSRTTKFFISSAKDGQVPARGNNKVSGRGRAPHIIPHSKTLKTSWKS